MLTRLAALLCFVLAGTTGCTGLPHAFVPERARDFAQHGVSRDARESAILLLPENVRLHRNSRVRRPSTLVDEVVLGLGPLPESYAGPARLFLSPGRQSYQLELKTDDGPIDSPFVAALQASTQYLIDVDESEDDVTWSLIKLSDESYADLYPPPSTTR